MKLIYLLSLSTLFFISLSSFEVKYPVKPAPTTTVKKQITKKERAFFKKKQQEKGYQLKLKQKKKPAKTNATTVLGVFSIILALIFCPVGLGLSIWTKRVGSTRGKQGLMAVGIAGMVLSILMTTVAVAGFILGSFFDPFFVTFGIVCLVILIAGIILASVAKVPE